MKRINRFSQDRGFMTASGVKRIARGRDVSGEDQTPIAAAVKPVRDHADAERRIMLCLQAKSGALSTLDREVAYVARALAELNGDTAVVLVLFGQLDQPQCLADMGIDEVAEWVDESIEHYQPEAKVEALFGEYQRVQPQHVLFAESAQGDSDLARRFAVRAGLSLATDVFEVSDAGVRRACGNGRYHAHALLPAVIALRAGTTGALDLEFTTAVDAQSHARKPMEMLAQSPNAFCSGSWISYSA